MVNVASFWKTQGNAFLNLHGFEMSATDTHDMHTYSHAFTDWKKLALSRFYAHNQLVIRCHVTLLLLPCVFYANFGLELMLILRRT